LTNKYARPDSRRRKRGRFFVKLFRAWPCCQREEHGIPLRLKSNTH